MNTFGMTFPTDLDGTAWIGNPNFRPQNHILEVLGRRIRLNHTFTGVTGDFLRDIRELVGSINPVTGEPWGRTWDYSCKVLKTLSFEDHLAFQLADVLNLISVEECIALAQSFLLPAPGVIEFYRFCIKEGIEPIFVTNGVDVIAEALVRHFFGAVIASPRIFANRLEGVRLKGLDGAVGVDKARVVGSLMHPVGFAGDSGSGDGPGALAVAKLGGFVFALGGQEQGSLAHFCYNNIPVEQWKLITTYDTATSIMMQRLHGG